METKQPLSVDEKHLFEIAKIISNEYIGKERTFTADRKDGYWYLNSNVCDYAPFIRVYEKNNKISSITVCGDYTDGWQEISSYTWGRIIKYLNILNIKHQSNG